MKRNMDLIRLQLLELESEQPVPELNEFTEDQKVYHMALCIEAGLVDGEVIKNSEGWPATAIAIRLTWSGHEFLDAAKNEKIWKKAGERIKKAGVQVTMSVLEGLLKSLLKERLRLP